MLTTIVYLTISSLCAYMLVHCYPKTIAEFVKETKVWLQECKDVYDAQQSSQQSPQQSPQPKQQYKQPKITTHFEKKE